MFDVLIIGLGCAGYTAAIYTARYKLKTFIVGAEDGGMGLTAAEVGNWPGIIDIKGPDLMENFKKHAISFEEVTHKVARVEKLEKIGQKGQERQEGGFRITLQGGEVIEGKTVILATGSAKRMLGTKGEKEFSGKGVTYCATCDAFFYRNKDVAVIGGGDSAVEGAAIAAQVAKTVYLIHRRNAFRAEPYWVDRVQARPNVKFVLERNVAEIVGDQKVRSVTLDKPWEGKDSIPVDGVFIEVGSIPSVELATSLGAKLDPKGFIAVTPDQQTSVPGLFAAGDNTSESNHFAQFTTAAGEGAVAANGAFTFLQG
ncbi:MAG: FAD-dependent oxidoreductase [Patescibacteria group bacterium]